MVWYRKNARDLPWRHTRDPYKIWISEIMLQQTTVNAVIPYYQKWIKRFPTVENVARANETTILKMWQGLGYYSRARNIHKSAKIITKEFHKKVPHDSDALRRLPGFGPYTVGAVLSIAFDIRYPIIDANVRRVLMRTLGMEGLADTTQDKAILKHLNTLLPFKDISVFNQALMELGALICSSQSPACLLCPVKTLCRAYKLGKQEIIPQTKKKQIKEIHAAIAVIEHKGRYLIQQRPNKGLLANLWEFPGGKLEAGEKPVTALKREVKEEIQADVKTAKFLMKVVHYYTQFKVNLHVYRCQCDNLPKETKSMKWVNLQKLDQFPMPSGSAKIVDKLLQMV